YVIKLLLGMRGCAVFRSILALLLHLVHNTKQGRKLADLLCCHCYVESKRGRNPPSVKCTNRMSAPRRLRIPVSCLGARASRTLRHESTTGQIWRDRGGGKALHA